MPNPAESVTFPKSAVTFAEIRTDAGWLERVGSSRLKFLSGVLMVVAGWEPDKAYDFRREFTESL
ncbi:hypothetical protein [Paraburkholderia azotifigens]|uniref:hypothetical protein n=1 Tax=Paraburkholderia azotifigens TaxID=2057004 RepID=UPI00142EB10D|nr:hypothetical protein [Paraburkholderia azotifigens]